MLVHRGVDQHVGVERVHVVEPSARRPGRSHVGDERRGAIFTERRLIGEPGAAALLENLTHAVRIAGAARPKRVRTDDDRDRLTMAGERHLFAIPNAVEDLGKSGSGLAHCHDRHALYCTWMYINVQNGGLASQSS
jgi:hypothetical protein